MAFGTDTRPSLPRPRRHDPESHVVPAPDRGPPRLLPSAKDLIVMGAATRADSNMRRRLTKQIVFPKTNRLVRTTHPFGRPRRSDISSLCLLPRTLILGVPELLVK